MRGKWALQIGIAGMLAMLLAGCAGLQKEKGPIVLTLWHVYGGQTDSPLNRTIDRFNETRGRELGIQVQVTSVSNTNTIHEAVLSAARKEPGAAELPDMFVSYPKTVLSLPDQSILADYNDYFSAAELDAYLPAFLEEGKLDGRLVIFPVAKSTEILFINKTLFDRFAAETGAEERELATWEGLFRLAKRYAEWTDAETPDIPNDGKSFFVHDYHFNYFQVGCESLGEHFFREGDAEGQLSFGPMFRRVWEPYADAALSGGVWLREGYATEPLRTGGAIVSVASSASVLYYEDVVTYGNNISEPIEVVARPVPVFEGGERLVMQRGAGFCMVKSSPERERAAAAFLKWLTEPVNNVEFVTKTGYMPVTEEAFRQLPEIVKDLENPKYRSLYRALAETERDYRFYVAPLLPNYLDLEMRFEKNVRLELSRARQAYREAVGEEQYAGGDIAAQAEKERQLEQAYQNLLQMMG